jgi:hypothetical protein
MNFCGSLIQAQSLLDCVGKGRKRSAWDRLLPVLGNPNIIDRVNRLYYELPSGSLLSETFKGKAILPQKWEKAYLLTDHGREGFYRILTSQIGLGARVAKIVANRPISHIKRIEGFISGIVDSLWLADECVFMHDGPEIFVLRDLVRKIFSVGCTDLTSLVDQWKSWINFLFHKVAATETIGKLEKPAKNNIFSRLSKLPYINRLEGGERNMLLLQHLAHICSSRQLPYMGKSTELKAREKFKEVLNSPFQPEPRIIVQLGLAARRIGGICKSIHPKLDAGACHISVTSSGEFDYTIEDGGQAAAVVAAIKRILLRIPDADLEEDTPFGIAYQRSGIPLWKTLFRSEPAPAEWDFLDQYYPIKEQPGRFRGLDGCLGQQLMYVAWKESDPLPVLRTSVVPEMGNKARHITLSDYWLNVLQAPLAHVLKDAVKFHPSVFSSFHRQDQAWEAVKAMLFQKVKDLQDGHFVLSSDLKDATNAQQFEVTKSILRGFIAGANLSFSERYINLVLNLIGPRLVLFPDITSVISRVGIMMGEAIAKPSLTLLNLAIEELAYLMYKNRLDLLVTPDPAPYSDWRFLHIGGDDHLAKGPRRYLELITEIHLSAGSHISPGQHGYSRILVKYCERFIWLENLQYGSPVNKDYDKSIIVDSVKVRLLEPGWQTMDKKDNKNTAIGKSSALANVLDWLPKDRKYFTTEKIESIRSLFVNRMGPMLPRKAINPKAFYAIHLPTIVGGFGLGHRSSMHLYLDKAPKPTQALLAKARAGIDVTDDLKIFKRLNRNVSARGVTSILEYQEQLEEQMKLVSNSLNPITWKEILLKFPPVNYNNRRSIAEAAEAGILTIDEFVKRSTRGNLFQELLLGKKDLNVFNTRPYVKTYHDCVWTYAEESGLMEYHKLYTPFTEKEFANAITALSTTVFFDINQITTIDTGSYDPAKPDEETFEFEDVPFSEVFTKGLPSLMVNPNKLGIRTTLIRVA